MSESDIKLADVSLQIIDNLLNGSPSGNVGSFEPHEFLLCVEYLSFFDNELWLINIGPSGVILLQSVGVLVCQSFIIVIKLVLSVGASRTASLR